jgi:multiple sugar transport system permease protein
MLDSKPGAGIARTRRRSRARQRPVPTPSRVTWWRRRSPWLRALTYLVLVTVAVLYIYPFLIELGTAFKTNPDATAHAANPIPHNWVIAAFTELSDQGFPHWFENSVYLAVSVTVGRLVFDSMAGYALSRIRFHGRRALFSAFVAVLGVPGIVLLIPRFLVYLQLGIYNTYTGMIIPLITDAAGVFIMKQFFESIPESLEEAARIDGAGVIRIYWSIMLPLARPALMTLAILSFQASWNDFPDILVAESSPSLDTLTTGVGRLVSGQLGAASTEYPLKMAAALLMTLPVAIIFFTFQRYIVRTGEGATKE